jgi:hypothetical protein
LFDGCSFLSSEPTLAPRQPYVQLAESGGAALFVLTSGCGKGALSYRYSSGIAGKADLACNATAAGVALPALAFFADDPKTAMALYFDVPLSARDALDDCGAAAPAPLRALLVEKAASASPALAKAVERTLAPDSISLRPPGVAPVAGTAVVLVAAPAGNDVAVWSVTRDALKAGGADPGVITIPDLVGARSAAIAVSPTGSVAVAAELGCPGSQSVRLALGNFDAPTASVGFSASIEVAPTGALATQPAVAWNAARGEWLVTWLSSGGLMQARRFTPDGTPSGGAVDIASPSGGGTPASDGTLYVLGAESGNSSFSAFSLGCN